MAPVLEEVDVYGMSMNDQIEGAEDGGFRVVFEGGIGETQERGCIDHSSVREAASVSCWPFVSEKVRRRDGLSQKGN